MSGYCGGLKLRLSLSWGLDTAFTLWLLCHSILTSSGRSQCYVDWIHCAKSTHCISWSDLCFVTVMTLQAHCAQASSEEWKADVWGNVSSFLVKLLHVLCCAAELVCDGVPVCLSCNISELNLVTLSWGCAFLNPWTLAEVERSVWALKQEDSFRFVIHHRLSHMAAERAPAVFLTQHRAILCLIILLNAPPPPLWWNTAGLQLKLFASHTCKPLSCASDSLVVKNGLLIFVLFLHLF